MFTSRKNRSRRCQNYLKRNGIWTKFTTKGVVDPITRFSRDGLWKGVDVGFIDGTVNGIGSFVTEIGSLIRKMQVGYVRFYAAFILFGALIVIGYFVYYGLKLVG